MLRLVEMSVRYTLFLLETTARPIRSPLHRSCIRHSTYQFNYPTLNQCHPQCFTLVRPPYSSSTRFYSYGHTKITKLKQTFADNCDGYTKYSVRSRSTVNSFVHDSQFNRSNVNDQETPKSTRNMCGRIMPTRKSIDTQDEYFSQPKPEVCFRLEPKTDRERSAERNSVSFSERGSETVRDNRGFAR